MWLSAIFCHPIFNFADTLFEVQDDAAKKMEDLHRLFLQKMNKMNKIKMNFKIKDQLAAMMAKIEAMKWGEADE